MRYDRAAVQAVREQLRRATEAADRGDYGAAHRALHEARRQVDRAWWLMVRQMRDEGGLGWEEIGRQLGAPSRQAIQERYERLGERFQQDQSPPRER